MGFPKASFIFCLSLFNVIVFNDIFLLFMFIFKSGFFLSLLTPSIESSADVAALPAGFMEVTNGLTK